MAHASMRGNMPRLIKIYGFFWDRHRGAFRKNSKAQEHRQMMQCCALVFFPQNTLGDGPAIWIFLQDSRIRVKSHEKYFKPKCKNFWYYSNHTWYHILTKNNLYPVIGRVNRSLIKYESWKCIESSALRSLFVQWIDVLDSLNYNDSVSKPNLESSWPLM